MATKSKMSELEAKVSKGLKGAYKKMVEFKKYKGTPIVISRNGKIIEIQPEDILPTTK